MLAKIFMLESGVIRGLLVAFVGLLGSVAALFGANATAFGAKAGPIIDGVSALLTAGGLMYAAWTRTTKPNPPLTDTAVIATSARLEAEGKPPAATPPKQGGFARPGVLIALSLACLVGAFAMQGCQGTKAAYAAADSPDETAFVVSEHYAAIVKEAAVLAARPGVPASAIMAMQRADQFARPVIEALRPLRDAYLASKSATDRALLEQKVNEAVLKLADLVRAVKAARGGV